MAKIDDFLSINLEDYAYKKGYTDITSGSTSTNWVTIKNPTTNDSIRMKRKSWPMMYTNNNQSLSQDRGNIINFVMNRRDPLTVKAHPNPSKQDFSETFSVLKKVLGTHQETPEKVEKADFTKIKNNNSTKSIKAKIKQLVDYGTITEKYLLEKRDIIPQVIARPEFAGVIKESPVVMPNNKVIYNTAFAKKDHANTTVGFVSHFFSKKENKNLKRVTQINETPGIVKSNVFESSNKLLIAESFIDALSHFQLNKPQTPVYASFQGSVSPEELNQLYSLYSSIDKNSNKAQVISITDNDFSGHLYDLNIGVAFHNKKEPNNFIEIEQAQNQTKFIFHNQNELTSEGAQVKEKMKKILEIENNGKTKHLTSYLNFVQLKDKAIFEIPIDTKRESYLYLKPLTEFVFKKAGIPFQNQKSKTKDWNDDIKHYQEKKQQLETSQKKKSRSRVSI